MINPDKARLNRPGRQPKKLARGELTFDWIAADGTVRKKRRTMTARLGERWPRILTLNDAALYVRMTQAMFLQTPEYAALVRIDPRGCEVVDREALDRVIPELLREATV